MKPLVQEIRKEFICLIVGMSFTAIEGAFIEGESVAVEIIPQRKTTSPFCDLHLRIIPYAQERDVPAEILAGARDAALEALADPNENVRFAARSYLDTIETTERIKPGDLAGWFVSCDVETEPNVQVHFVEETDQNGELWFRHILKHSTCRLSLSSSPVIDFTELRRNLAPAPPPPQASWTMPLAAKNDQSQLRISDKAETRIFHLVDGHITALLEQTMDGSAVLTLETATQEFAGATVHFFFGPEKGEVQLDQLESGTEWGGQIKLRHSFNEVSGETPSFEIVPVRRKK
jgi:hypothetical protein